MLPAARRGICRALRARRAEYSTAAAYQRVGGLRCRVMVRLSTLT